MTPAELVVRLGEIIDEMGKPPHAHQQAMQEIIEQRDMASREVNRLSQAMQAAQEANRDLLVKLAAALERIAELETYKAHHKTNLEYIAEICQEITVERRVNSALRERAQGLEARVAELEQVNTNCRLPTLLRL